MSQVKEKSEIALNYREDDSLEDAREELHKAASRAGVLIAAIGIRNYAAFVPEKGDL